MLISWNLENCHFFIVAIKYYNVSSGNEYKMTTRVLHYSWVWNVWYLKNESCPNRFNYTLFTLYSAFFSLAFFLQRHPKYLISFVWLFLLRTLIRFTVIRLESSYIMSQNNNVITIFIFHCSLHIILQCQVQLLLSYSVLCVFLWHSLKYIPFSQHKDQQTDYKTKTFLV